MEKIKEIIYTFMIFVALIIVSLSIFYNNAPNVEKTEPTETTIVEITRVG